MTLSKMLTSALFLVAGLSLSAPALAKPHGPPRGAHPAQRHEVRRQRVEHTRPVYAPRPVVRPAPRPVARPVVVRRTHRPTIYVNVAPPAPRFEARPMVPAPGYVWVDGYWSWTGAQYVWIPGQWQAPRVGYTWRPARWVQRGAQWRMVPGHWRHL